MAQPFEIRESAIQGRGAFATRSIRKGERVAEYIGERISWKEADRRYDDTQMKRHHTFLFSVTSRTVIDGAVRGNDSRFINHSCAPNCEAVDDGGRIFIESLRAIAEGEELTYDYAFERDDTHTAEDEALYACHCGAVACRGTILEPPKVPLPHSHHSAARHVRRHKPVDAADTPKNSRRSSGTAKRSARQAVEGKRR